MTSVISEPLPLHNYDECDVRHPTGPTTRQVPTPREHRQLSRIVLCLSGGGYRAAAFHLGALRRVFELGLVPYIDEIRAVSGGSILAAWLATCLRRAGSADSLNWEVDVARPFRAFLCTDIRTVPVLKTVATNWIDRSNRVRLLAGRIRELTGEWALSELPTVPRFRFLSTDLVSGACVALPESVAPDEWEVALGVAASACFPPVFGPLSCIDARGNAMALSDGGIYGNLGISGMVLSRSDCVLVSDASYPVVPISVDRMMPRLWVKRALRVAMQRGDASMRYQLWERDCASQRLEVWRISDTTNRTGLETYEYDSRSTRAISMIRTDLDRFTAAEVGILENHGYLRAASGVSWLLERMRLEEVSTSQSELLSQLSQLAVQNYFPMVIPPNPQYLSSEAVQNELAGSDHRVLKFRAARRIMSHRQASGSAN